MKIDGIQMESKACNEEDPNSHSPSNSSPKFPFLPPELISEIGLRLPIKSLFKFTSISKSWLALISTPEFRNTHFTLSTNTHHHILLLTPSQAVDCALSSLFHDPITQFTNLDYPKTSFCCSYTFAGSVDGLVCIADDNNNDVFVWNPSIRKYKKLPGPGPHTLYWRFYKSPRVYGFVRDQLHDDYKVVIVFCLEDEVRIYSVKSDSWSGVVGGPSEDLVGFRGKFVCEKLHWLSDDLCSIVAFDLAHEKWERMDHPCGGRIDSVLSVGVLGGDLSVFCEYKRFPVDVHADVWVMKEYGVEESWTKLCSIKGPANDPFLSLRPLSVPNKREIVVAFGHSFAIYNPMDGSFKYSNVVGCDDFYEGEIYVESFVWPFSGEGD